MSTKDAPEPHDEADDQGRTARMDSDLVDKLEFIVKKLSRRHGRRVTVKEYLSPIARPQIEADYAQEIEEEHKGLRKPGRK